MPNPMKGHEIATIDVAMVTLTTGAHGASASASVSGTGVTAASVVASTFSTGVSGVSGTYVFTYDNTAEKWKLGTTAIDNITTTYGITVTGTPDDGDTITVVFTAARSSTELGLTTGTQVNVDTELETTEGVKLVVKGVLIAQKREINTITGTTITLTDNVFNPEMVKMLQGGTIEYNADGSFKKYTPPVAGSEYNPEEFNLNLYTAHYDASGLVQGYEKVSYPNCTGNPVAFSAEDGTFAAPEYSIKSAPSTGSAPYTIDYVTTLPTLDDPDWD